MATKKIQALTEGDGMSDKEYDYQAVFDQYTEDPQLDEFHIFHLYDTGEKCAIDNSGFEDARHMNIVGYNKELKKKRDLGRHDEISFFNTESKPGRIRIFADGSTMIVFYKAVGIINTQSLNII